MLIKYIRKIKRKIFGKQNADNIKIDTLSSFERGENVKLRNVTIELSGNSKLILKNNVDISDYDIYIENSVVSIGENCILNKGYSAMRPRIIVSNKSRLDISANNLLRCTFWLRFGGVCKLGEYNGIYEDTEIRCDESVEIGNYNMISYQCMIYDTNTHTIYPKEKRRLMTKADYPYIGNEIEKPKTAAVMIGDDCWLGKRAVILKGTMLKTEVIVATSAVVSNLKVYASAVLAGNPAVVKERR